MRLKTKLLSLFLIGASPFLLHAKTTWIPITNGSVSFVIPYIPSSYPSPTGLNLNSSMLTWDDLEHASYYQVMGLNKRGQWVVITVTQDNFFEYSNQFFGYSDIRINACSLNTCDGFDNYASINIIGRLNFPKTNYTYDALGRLITVKDSLNGNSNFEYDAAGNRKKVEQNK